MCSQCALMRTQKHWDCLEKSKKISIEIQLMLFVYIYVFVSICAADCVCVSTSMCVSAAIKLQFWTEACIAFWHHLAKNEIEVLQM